MSGQPCAVAAQPGSEPVTLPQILEFADANAPVLRAARSTRARADASDVAAAPRMPSNPELTVYVGPRFGEVGTGVDVQVSLMQEIQIGGERGLRVEASQHFRTQTEAEIDQVRWFVHADVHAAFHRALVERERARLAERVVAFQTDILRVVERQIAAGSEAPLALRLAQAEVAQAQQQLVAAQQAYAASCIRLAQLSGWPVTTPPEPVGHAESPREPPALATLQTLARERVPSLVAGSCRVAPPWRASPSPTGRLGLALQSASSTTVRGAPRVPGHSTSSWVWFRCRFPASRPTRVLARWRAQR
ncbi:MAG: TolC family protein [Sandaracinaceae bacterium]|nr:TolC family protein [Sandaracinaceae bacterium]